MANTTLNALKTAKPNNPRFQSGKKTKVVEFRGTVLQTGAADGDLMILAEGLSMTDRIAAIRCKIAMPSLTGTTSTDIGFFRKKEDGTYVALDADVLVNGVSYASGAALGTDLLAGNTSLAREKNIAELLALGADQAPAGGVVLAVTFGAKSTAADSVVALDIEIDEATNS